MVAFIVVDAIGKPAFFNTTWPITNLSTSRDENAHFPATKSVSSLNNCGFIFWNNPKPVTSVVLEKEGKILMIKEYKHGVQKEILQLPCGYIDKNEEPLAAAKRELAEETGYTSKKWTSLGAFTGSPGRLTHYYHFFLAEECEKTKEQKLDELETLDVFEYTKEEAEEALKEEDTDLVTPLGFLMAKEKWKKKE